MGWGDRTVRIDPSTLTQIGTSTLARIDVINTGAIALHPLSLSHLLPTIGTKVKLLIEPTDLCLKSLRFLQVGQWFKPLI